MKPIVRNFFFLLTTSVATLSQAEPRTTSARIYHLHQAVGYLEASFDRNCPESRSQALHHIQSLASNETGSALDQIEAKIKAAFSRATTRRDLETMRMTLHEHIVTTQLPHLRQWHEEFRNCATPSRR